jgi:ComF family protein
MLYILKILINLIYPASCQACGVKVDGWDKNICADCLKKIKKRTPPFCRRCGKQLSDSHGPEDACPDCKNGGVYFDRAFSIFHYNDMLKGLVHKFKYGKITCMAKEFSDMAAAFVKQRGINSGIDMILPVPMHPLRLIKREINPSEALAGNIASKLAIRYSGRFIKKVKNTRAQSRLGRIERMENIRGSFALTGRGLKDIPGKNILLVDDLFTTGATVNECAMILKKAGAGRVDVLTLARGDTAS